MSPGSSASAPPTLATGASMQKLSVPRNIGSACACASSRTSRVVERRRRSRSSRRSPARRPCGRASASSDRRRRQARVRMTSVVIGSASARPDDVPRPARCTTTAGEWIVIARTSLGDRRRRLLRSECRTTETCLSGIPGRQEVARRRSTRDRTPIPSKERRPRRDQEPLSRTVEHAA